MYSPKLWNPSDNQKKELKSLIQHPGFIALVDKAEYDQAEAGKYLLSLLQSLDTKNADDMLTLEKEGIKAEAVSNFLNSIKYFTQEASSPE